MPSAVSNRPRSRAKPVIVRTIARWPGFVSRSRAKLWSNFRASQRGGRDDARGSRHEGIRGAHETPTPTADPFSRDLSAGTAPRAGGSDERTPRDTRSAREMRDELMRDAGGAAAAAPSDAGDPRGARSAREMRETRMREADQPEPAKKSPKERRIEDNGNPAGPERRRTKAAPASRPERPVRGQTDDTGARWFTVNVGRSKNADPKWLIPLLCRKGSITKRSIGKIQVGMRETRVEIAGDKAAEFAEAIRRPDDKDRNIHIEPLDEE